MAVVADISSVDTQTWLMGHFPLYWAVSLVCMQLYTKEALPAGSTVIAIPNPQCRYIFEEFPTVSKLLQTVLKRKTTTLSFQLLIRETVHISWEKLQFTFKFHVHFLEHLLNVNVLYEYQCLFLVSSAREVFAASQCNALSLVFTSDPSTSREGAKFFVFLVLAFSACACVILFPWRVNGHFCFTWSVIEGFFSVIRESIF